MDESISSRGDRIDQKSLDQIWSGPERETPIIYAKNDDVKFPIGFENTAIIQNSRREKLPYLLPPGHNVPIWKILSKVISQDMTKVCLPVILSEPLNALQKSCEMMKNWDIIEQMIAKPKHTESDNEQGHSESPKDSCRRLMCCAAFQTAHYSIQKKRFKKPFNPIIGETFEYVTENFRFFSEQVSHHPPITAFVGEAPGLRIESVSELIQSFQFGGGTGTLRFKQVGVMKYYLSEFNDVIVTQKQDIAANNLIMGQTFIDLENTIEGYNERTNDRFQIKYIPKGWKKNQSFEGKCWDGSGKLQYTLSGEWNDSMYLTDSKGDTELLWKCPEFDEESAKQYYFTDFSIQLNYLSKDMSKSGYLPSTDSRFRGDMRLFEEGKMDEADVEKIRLEQKQRANRKVFEAKKQDWQPVFFDILEEENPFTKKMERVFKQKTGQDNYWSRRQRKEWSGLPDIF